MVVPAVPPVKDVVMGGCLVLTGGKIQDVLFPVLTQKVRNVASDTNELKADILEISVYRLQDSR